MYEEGLSVSENGSRNPRQVFGSMVRFYREKAGISRAEVGRRICKSDALVEAIELGRRPATAEVTLDLETALDAGGALVHLREKMGSALNYQAFPAWFQDWALREAEATVLRWFEPLVVPGLLQTEEYARAVFRTRFGLTAEEIDEQVAARIKRQEILAADKGPQLWVVLDEWVLRRPVGGPRVMLEQVTALVEAARQPRIMIQVIPATVGAHEGLASAFAVADFEDTVSVGYQESARGGQVIEDLKDVASLTHTWDTLRADALPRAASLAVLEEAAKPWTATAA
jgi:transcriptional regulator with XRE-family HTH domain